MRPRSRLPKTRDAGRLIAGVDAGGTWVRLAIVNPRGQLLQHWTLPSRGTPRLALQLRQQLRRRNVYPERLIVASRGMWKAADRRTLKQQLRGIARHIDVMSDVEGAWYAAYSCPHPRGLPPRSPSPALGRGRGMPVRFSPLPGYGLGEGIGARAPKGEGRIILIAGTGSIALMKDARGRWTRAGGLGPDKGDEGSAYWIGRQWLSPTSHRSVRRTAAACRQVFGRRRSDPRARQILCEAYRHLEELVTRLSQGRPARVALAGGLFDFPFFRRGFCRLLKRQSPMTRPFRLRRPTEVALARFIIRGEERGSSRPSATRYGLTRSSRSGPRANSSPSEEV